MLLDVVMSAAGLALLLVGGELLVRGATALALRFRVSPSVIGLTVVAAGTSMPELVVSIGAAVQGLPDVAIGNVVGSNIYNILLILGLAALVRPLTTTWTTIRLEWPVMALAAWTMHLLSRDGMLDRLEGAYLLAGLIAFVAWMVRLARKEVPDAERESLESVADSRGGATVESWARSVGGVTIGVALLGLGAHLLVSGASSLAADLGVSQRVIGLTVVAIGTSLPELITSVLAAWRGNSAIAVGNVVGSNIFNVLGILGATALVHPIPVNLRTIELDNWVMLGVTLMLLPLMRTGFKINRWEGGLLLAGAVVWSWTLL